MEKRKARGFLLSLSLLLLTPPGSYYLCTCTSSQSSGDDESFGIRHSESGRCLAADIQRVWMSECQGLPAERWKWGTGDVLFHPASSACLEMEAYGKEPRLRDCFGPPRQIWWCKDGALTVDGNATLSVVNGSVVTTLGLLNHWVRDGTTQSICLWPYRELHSVVSTTGGNSYGALCEFPFLYNGSWHYGCLPDEDDPTLSWCSTTRDFTQDGKRGYCLLPETGCGVLWERNGNGSCYQRNLQAAMRWYWAQESCHRQGADLLSISSPEELNFITTKGDLPALTWIGLTQKVWSQGWYWSDGTPLALVNWKKGIQHVSQLSVFDCGAMNPQGAWVIVNCETKLPYICKKKLNQSESESDSEWANLSTVCKPGWTPWNGFCYLYEKRLMGMEKAQEQCVHMGGGLLSLLSFAEMEAVSEMFPANASSATWTALRGEGKPLRFQWTDGNPVTYTDWYRANPQPDPNSNISCVSSYGTSYQMHITPCVTKLPFICKMVGDANGTRVRVGCPTDGDWRKHGNACYKVNTTEVPFKDSCNLTIMNRFEQAFINSLLKEHMMSRTLYFWTSLQDMKRVGEYQWVPGGTPGDLVTYTNWRYPEPAYAGGCVVLSKLTGEWEVTNCRTYQAGTICKQEVGPHVPPEPEPDPSIPCPDGWMSMERNSYCYKVFHDERLSHKRTWPEAEHFCQSLGAHLVSFSHSDEMNALHQILRATIRLSFLTGNSQFSQVWDLLPTQCQAQALIDDRYIWVGMNRRNPTSGSSWEWSDGRPVSTNIFPPEFHQSDEYNRHCVAFKSLKGGSLKKLFIFLLHDIKLRSFYATPFHCDARLEWVCQIPKGKTPETPEWYKPGGHHETSIFFGGQEFWFVNDTQLTYEEASLYCSSKSSKLARPITVTALMKIFDKISKMSTDGQSWWVDMHEPGVFIPIILNQWQHQFLGKCTSLSTDSMLPEFDCEQKLQFVCEALNTTSLEKHPAKPHPLGTPCEKDTLAFKDKCYTVFRPLHLSFMAASEHCKTLRGTLLTISNQMEQDFITSSLPNQTAKSWIGLKMNLYDREWVDDSPVTFLNFNPLLMGQLRPMLINTFNPNSMEVCAYMFNEDSPMLGTWDYMPCHEPQYVSVCQHYVDKPEEARVPEGIFKVRNHTYSLILKTATWSMAQDLCKLQGMDLASIHDTFQQASLSVLVSRFGGPLWIGLFSDDGGTHYSWADRSHTVFSRWPKEDVEGDCVYQDTDGYWKATECEQELPGAICHLRQNETSAVPKNVTVKCPHKINGPNWIPFRNNCYTFQLASSRWDHVDKNISNTCKKLDHRADLLTIRDEAENTFVTEQLQPFADLAQFIWLAMFKGKSGLKWYDDTDVQFSNWKFGRPNITETFMVVLGLEGLWEFVTNQHIFIPLRERSIVACKIDNDHKEEFQTPDHMSFGKSNYSVLKGHLSWLEAAQACGAKGGQLASIHGTDQDNYLKAIVKRDGFPLWIGLSSQQASGSLFEWSDGTKYNYGPPNFLTSGEGNCVFLSPRGTWERTYCLSKLEGALCSNTSALRSNRQSSMLKHDCPQAYGVFEWVQNNDHCYMFDIGFYNYTVYTMEDAMNICKELGASAQLLRINDEPENSFVSRYVSDNPFVTGMVWLDVDQNSPGYSNWQNASTTPSTRAESGCAVLLSSKGGTWTHVNCQGSYSRVVCKAPHISSSSSPAALILFLVVVILLLAAVGFVFYKKSRSHFSSTVRYKRNFDEADSTSIITQTE